MIGDLEQRISSIENEKEEYRIKNSSIQTKLSGLQQERDLLIQQISTSQARIKELEFEIQIKKEKYESVGFRESVIRIQNELDSWQQLLASTKLDRDSISKRLQTLEYEKSEVKSDNIKMCQLIREYEDKVRVLENNSKDLMLTYESKLKVLQSENKSLHSENDKLSRKAEESILDWENLTKEYKTLLNQLTSSKIKDEQLKLNNKEEKLIRDAYESELKKLSILLQSSEDIKKQMIEKYTEELESIKENYDKTIKIQTEHFKLFKDRIEQEFESLNSKLKKKEDSKKPQHESGNTPKTYSKPKDSITDLIRENTLKESNLKVLRNEAKAFNGKITKLKTRNAELKSKIMNLQSIIDSNPRLKKLIDKQKGELDTTTHKMSVTPYFFNISDASIGMKEYNEILEQNISLKIEWEKKNSKVLQLEQLNSKIQSKHILLLYRWDDIHGYWKPKT